MEVIKGIDFDPDFEAIQFSPVIKAEVLSAFDQAKVIIERARKEASRLRRRAKDVLAQSLVEREEELKKGYEEGHQQGLGELTEKIFEVDQEHRKIVSEIEPSMVRMVMDIVEKVIGKELKKGAIVDVVRKTLGESVGRKIVVRVNPQDLVILQEHQASLSAALSQDQTLSVKADESVSLGGCIVESELGTVDARLETQLGAIKKALGL